MNVRMVKGYVLIIFAGVILIAVAVLLFLQWGNAAEFSLYGMNMTPNTGLLMIISAVGGALIYLLFKMLGSGVRCLREAKRQQTQHETEHRLSELEKAQQGPPSAS
ncbi:MAG: hypothetical protein ACYSTL_07950 [Planctomycetota bacterium]|jgi:uncharacterized integral membrane protein